MHDEGAEHELDPEGRRREEDLAEGGEAVHFLGEVVAVELEVDEALDALGVVAEARLPVGLVSPGDRSHFFCRRQGQLAVEDEGEEFRLHLGRGGDGAEGGPREAEEGEGAVFEEGAEDLLVEVPRILAEGREVLCLGRILLRQQHGEGIAVARTGDDGVGLEARAVGEDGFVLRQVKGIPMKFGALHDHGGDEALVLAAEFREGGSPLVHVQFADFLQDHLVVSRQVRRRSRGQFLRQLVHVANPVAEDVRIRVAAAIRVQVGDPAVALPSRNDVAVLSPDDDGHFLGLFGDLLADVRPGLAGADDEDALLAKHLGLLVILRVDDRPLELIRAVERR
mmetsp:Transcript_16337/g.53194  ORF Transcript_16337/g.53194 Transcript_16337/m.53194 type:complete len:338 (+) Transcript_16337:414-1427(+)